jgi:hypothetical protein
MDEKLPFIWRAYYRKEATAPEKVSLETAHEQARQYLNCAAAASRKSTRR